MKYVIQLLCLALLTTSVASAALLTFNDRGTFDTAAPGLALEDFEGGSTAAGAIVGFAGPLDSTSSNAAFSPGDILAGIAVRATGGSSLVALGSGVFSSMSSVGVGADLFAEATELLFAPGVIALGFDLWAGGGGAGSALPVTISVFDTSDVLLAAFAPTTAVGDSIFFGVVSDAASIGRVLIATQSGEGEIIDNVAFGTPGISDVPEPATWTLMLAGLGLAAFRRKRS